MFMIFKNNRPSGSTKFNTYETARQTLRKRLRKLTTLRSKNQPSIPYTLLGYSIRKV